METLWVYIPFYSLSERIILLIYSEITYIIIEKRKKMSKVFKCKNCKITTISKYRWDHCDKLCEDCWEIIYGSGDSSTPLDRQILGDITSFDVSGDDEYGIEERNDKAGNIN
jgi:hypothetical protein